MEILEMYVYSIGYHTCEESDYEYLNHKEKFSKEQLTAVTHDCVLEVLMVVKEKKKIDENEYLHSYQDIHHEVIEKLIKKYKFEKLKVEETWEVFGWASLFKPGDWDSYREEPDDLTALVETIRKAGYTEDDDDYLGWHKKINKEG